MAYLTPHIRGQFYRLYWVMAVFSRKIVACEARDSESSEHTSVLICKACLRKGVQEGDCVPHSDNGNSMKGRTTLVISQNWASFGLLAVRASATTIHIRRACSKR